MSKLKPDKVAQKAPQELLIQVENVETLAVFFLRRGFSQIRFDEFYYVTRFRHLVLL